MLPFLSIISLHSFDVEHGKGLITSIYEKCLRGMEMLTCFISCSSRFAQFDSRIFDPIEYVKVHIYFLQSNRQCADCRSTINQLKLDKNNLELKLKNVS